MLAALLAGRGTARTLLPGTVEHFGELVAVLVAGDRQEAQRRSWTGTRETSDPPSREMTCYRTASADACSNDRADVRLDRAISGRAVADGTSSRARLREARAEASKPRPRLWSAS